MAYEIARKPRAVEWEIHKVGCRDLKNRESFVENRNTVRELVEDEYAGHMSDEGSPWTDYRREFIVMLCAKGIPEE